eukprot:TRINITY_DN5190_c0_g2_i3.p1 TRINITY_DN5190_c0_g2~~TRINITY_DN5190_c0_g2_i3.p1  ORF type:complete len:347 (+),score=100.41 TRINITY_DN5190_c0_g2_i3:817-1857(+)
MLCVGCKTTSGVLEETPTMCSCLESQLVVSVALHLLMKKSWGLYNKVLLQSPGPYSSVSSGHAAQRQGETFIKATPCAGVADRIGCLRNLTWKQLLGFQPAQINFTPTIDGIQLRGAVTDLFPRGEFNKDVPAMIGNDVQEGNFFAASLMASIFRVFINLTDPNPPVSAQQFQGLAAMAAASLPPSNVTSVISYYTNIAQQTTFWRGASALFGDFYIDCGERIIANSLSRMSNYPVFHYVFTHSNTGGAANGVNATHGSEMAYFFFDDQYFYCEDKPGCHFSPTDIMLAKKTVKVIEEFHSTGKVSFWQPYVPGQPNNTLNWGTEFSLFEDKKDCTLWESVLNVLL